MTANAQGKRGKRDHSTGAQTAAPQEPGSSIPAPRLKPRPRLLAVLALVFAVWVAFLVTLYFKTVSPRRSTIPGYDAQGKVETAPQSDANR